MYFYFYFSSKKDAQAVATELEKEGCSNIQVKPAPTSLLNRIFGVGQWSCSAENYRIPEDLIVFAMTDRYNALAEKHNGVYDGWEAEIIQ